MISTFCDETSNAEVYCVGGYLFKPENASRFQVEWNEIMLPLKSRGITAFHASDCAVGENEFANLSQAERMALLRDLIDLIHDTAEVGYVAEVKHDDYRQWLAHNPTMSAVVGSEHGVASFYCLSSFKDWAKRAHYEDDLDYEFEAGNKPFMDEVSALMYKISSNLALREVFKYGHHGFGLKGVMRQLEAADLFVWAYQKLQVNHRLYPECVRIGRGLFHNSKVPHRAAILSEFSLIFSAIFNESHSLRSREIAL
jgi:hypothetical protein